MIAGRDIQVAGSGEDHVQYEFRPRIEIPRGEKFAVRFGLVHRSHGLPLDPVDLTVRISGGVENAVLVQRQGLNLQLFGLEDAGRLPLRSDAIYAGGRTRSGIEISAWVGSNRPDVSGWSG